MLFQQAEAAVQYSQWAHLNHLCIHDSLSGSQDRLLMTKENLIQASKHYYSISCPHQMRMEQFGFGFEEQPLDKLLVFLGWNNRNIMVITLK